ncbi:MAG: hypothetical protein WC867_05525 [Candidatus Pacearchaeota archaeon]|jgi:hypothetical protein
MKKKRSEAFKKENLFILYLLIIVFIITIISYIIFRPSVDSSIEDMQKVIKVYEDGTLELESGIKVKFLCITPNKNSKSFLDSLVLNKNVRIISDPKENDGYKTISRFVYLSNEEIKSCEIAPQENNENIVSDESCKTIGADELLINKELLDKGYAKYEPYSNKNCEKLL